MNTWPQIAWSRHVSQADQCKDDAARQKGKTEAWSSEFVSLGVVAQMLKDWIGRLWIYLQGFSTIPGGAGVFPSTVSQNLK